MFRRFLYALPLALMPWFLAACAVTQADRPFQIAYAFCQIQGDGWSCETRRVKTATPEGEAWKEITYCKNPLGMEFALVPAGRFEMGSGLSPAETARRFGGGAKDFADEHPRHAVRISHAFLMGAYEVTNAQYRRFRPDHYSGDYEGASLTADSQPATSVSQDDAKAFCGWLSKRDGVTYRLPTEAEWEYACRAGSLSPHPWGEEISARFCNFADASAPSLSWRDETADDGYAATAPVGGFPANAFGLYDMIGNVWEWCADWYGEDYYAKSPSDDPAGPPSNLNMCRVLRGGSWMNAPSFCRSSFRLMASQVNRSANNGFRVVVELQER